jgi:HNH endonuclease
MQWREAVLSSLHSYCVRHNTRSIERQQFIEEELPVIVNMTNSQGLTPDQTLSRNLQELGEEGVIQRLQRGQYLLLDTPIDVESEDLTDEEIDLALRVSKLKLGKIETDDKICFARRHKGQDRIRKLVTGFYGGRCASCDVTDPGLLIASHIATWAEAPEHRGDLRNVICLCRIHDALFESGYWSLDENLGYVKRTPSTSRLVQLVLENMEPFRLPDEFHPSPQFLQVHRARCGFPV